jgi:microcystin-dependent protein
MSQPFLGQIEVFAFGFAPKGWAICAGQTMSIQQNQALFSLLGTVYGGDGRATFLLPDLRGRLAVGQGSGPGLTPRTIGEVGGEENHTLLYSETPTHNHSVAAAAQPAPGTNTNIPGNTVVLAQTVGQPGNFSLALYAVDPNPSLPMAQPAIGLTGGQPHSNMMPYNTLNCCIALTGIFPSRG